MKNYKVFCRILLILLVFNSTGCNAKKNEEKPLKTVVIIIDGLRKDYISEANTPNIYKLSQVGVWGLHSHSIFPTLTRVNASSYATGSYPAKHGILGNSIYLSEVDPVNGINTGDVNALINADKVLNGKLLRAKTFGEWVEDNLNDSDFTIYSTGTTGQSYLLNQKIRGRGIVNPELILPESLKQEIISKIGEIPGRARPNLPRHQWVTDAFIALDLTSSRRSISTIWYSDPDGTAHATGIGSAMTMESIKIIDGQIGRILAFIDSNNLHEQVNIIISADHGFSTHQGEFSIEDLLVDKGLKKKGESDDIITVGGAVYVRDKTKLRAIVEVLQAEDWIGAIFSNNDFVNELPGTHSMNDIYWDHKGRSADLYVDVNWNDKVNEFGYPGFSFHRGTAGHGSSSPYEMQTPFIAVGPSFREGFENPLPTALIDIMPTVLHLYGVELKNSEIDGRVLDEILKENSSFYSVQIQSMKEVENVSQGIIYRSVLFQTSWDGKTYFDYSKTSRK